MTGKFNVSFRAHREKSFSSLKNAIFELNHYPFVERLVIARELQDKGLIPAKMEQSTVGTKLAS
jgi:hypothetical protein